MKTEAMESEIFAKMTDQELIDHARKWTFSALEKELAARLEKAIGQQPVAVPEGWKLVIDPSGDCVLSNDDYHEAEIIEKGKRLFSAVDAMCAQAGTETNETVEWLCGEYGGMAKLFLKYFSPTAPAQGQEADWKDAEIKSLCAKLAEANKARANDALQMGGIISTMRLERDELIEALGIAQATINCAAKNTPHAFARVVEKYSDEIILATSKEGGAV